MRVRAVWVPLAVVALGGCAQASGATDSPVRGQLAYFHNLGAAGPIYRVDAQGGRPARVGPAGRVVWALSWSPSGGRIAYIWSGSSMARSVDIVDVGSGRSRTLFATSFSEDTLFQVAWAPRGGRIALVRGQPGEPYDPHVDVIDLHGLVAARGLAPDISIDSRLSWAPDGERLVYAARDGHLRVLLPTAGRRTLPLIGSDPAWSPGGRWVGFATKRGIAVARIRGGGYRLLTHGGKRDMTPTWSPDGGWLAFARRSGVCNKPEGVCRQDLYRVALNGGTPQIVRRTPGIIEMSPVWGR